MGRARKTACRVQHSVDLGFPSVALKQSIEQAIRKVNKNQAVANVETWEEIKSQSVAPARLGTVLLAIFAGIAVLLAAVGIYGVVSYSVAQRVHEMAIRRALGASPGGLLKLVTRKSDAHGPGWTRSRRGRGTRAHARIGELALRHKPDGSGDIGRRRGVARSGGALGLLFSSLARDEGGPPDDLAP